MLLLPGGCKFGGAGSAEGGFSTTHTDLLQESPRGGQPLPVHPGNLRPPRGSLASEPSGCYRPADTTEDPDSHGSEHLWVPQAAVLPHQLELRRSSWLPGRHPMPGSSFTPPGITSCLAGSNHPGTRLLRSVSCGRPTTSGLRWWSPIWSVATKPQAVTMGLSVVKDAKCLQKGHKEKFDLQLSEQLRLHHQ